MTLPTTRDITLAPGTQIPSTLLNNLQDMIIGGRFGTVRRVTPAASGMGPGGGAPEGLLLTPTGVVRLVTGDEWMVPLLVHPGERVTSINIVVAGTIAATLDAQFMEDGVLVGAPLALVFAATATFERASIAFAGPRIVGDPSSAVLEGYMSVFFSNGAASTADIRTIDYLVDK